VIKFNKNVRLVNLSNEIRFYKNIFTLYRNMVKHTCERCWKTFTHKGNFVRHISRKVLCEEIEKPDPENISEECAESKASPLAKDKDHMCYFCTEKFIDKKLLYDHFKVCKHKKTLNKVQKLQELIVNQNNNSGQNYIQIEKIHTNLNNMQVQYLQERKKDHINLYKQKKLLKNSIKDDKTKIQTLLQYDKKNIQKLIVSQDQLCLTYKKERNLRLLDKKQVHNIIKEQDNEIKKFKYIIISITTLLALLIIIIFFYLIDYQ